MDVIVDKVSDGDAHALTIRELKAIHRFLVSKLDFNAKVYRLSNELPKKSRFDRPVIYDMISRKLTICSRGLSQEESVKSILIEALQESDPILRAASYRHLSNAQMKVATERANKLYNELALEVDS
jgi:hypothetical protein